MTNPNEPAFVRRQVSKKPPTKDDAVYEHGLTKREYFAAMAMQGLLAGSQGDVKWSEIHFAIGAINLADALIEALNKEPK